MEALLGPSAAFTTFSAQSPGIKGIETIPTHCGGVGQPGLARVGNAGMTRVSFRGISASVVLRASGPNRPTWRCTPTPRHGLGDTHWLHPWRA